MLCLSSKKSLLSGVSAVVLATTVGVSAVGVSGVLAQANAVVGDLTINASHAGN